MNPQLRKIYYSVRSFIPIKIRWLLQQQVARQIDGFSTIPMWPLPELSYRNAFIPPPLIPPTRGEKLSTIILTHDVDSKFGFDHIRDVCEVEKRLGFNSSWNIVPDLYEVDESVLDYLRDSGMEIGVHDWNHDGRLFSDKKIFDERVKKINRVIKRWGAKGFRAGMVFHNDEWMEQLECEYDSSYYDTDPFQPMGGGCGKIRPFMLGHLVELPYTMPQDHTLFVAGAEVRVPLNYDDADAGRRENWKWICDYCERIELDPQITQIDADFFVSRKGAKARRLITVSHPSTISRSYGAGRAHGRHREFKDADYLIKGVDIWKMKADWLVERGGMVLMITHPDYLCHPKIIRRLRRFPQIKKNRIFYDGWLGDEDRGQRTEVTPVEHPGRGPGSTGQGGRRAKHKYIYDGWLHSNDGDVLEVRDRGIVEEKWYGSLLEQYAGFLNWFKREFEGKYRHCLANEVVHRLRRLHGLGKRDGGRRSIGHRHTRTHTDICPADIAGQKWSSLREKSQKR